MREANNDQDFRSFREEVQAKRGKEIEWNKMMIVNHKEESKKKQQVSLGQERKRLLMLELLKKTDGPFTKCRGGGNVPAK